MVFDFLTFTRDYTSEPFLSSKSGYFKTILREEDKYTFWLSVWAIFMRLCVPVELVESELHFKIRYIYK